MDEKRKTKETNTFRFKSFADRVTEIDIRRSALYYIGHANEELPEDDETYFHQTIKKWSVLNLTDEYNQFSKKCNGIVTLPQLLHKKDFVVDHLLEKLSTATNLSLQPLLEILVVLGRDLREEFYPYFQRILDRLICLLNTKDPDQLEWTLICLAYLFKTMKPFLKRNISVVFHAILPLLDENRYSENVTNFAVECFSFIARDLKDYGKLLEIILKTVEKEHIQSIQGCGRLFFEIVRGVKGVFHSIADKFLEFLFESLLNIEEKRQDLLFEVISTTLGEILKFVHPHNIGLVWIVLCRVIGQGLQEKKVNSLNSLILLMSRAAQWRDGRFLAEMETIVPTILKVVDASSDDDTILLDNICTLVSVILLSSNAKVSQLDTSRMIKKLMLVSHREIFESFITRISTHTQFEILVLPDLLKFFELHFDQQGLELLAQVILQKSPLIKNGQKLKEWKKYPLQMKKQDSLKKFEMIFKDFDGETEKDEEFYLSLVLAPHVVGLNSKTIEKKCQELIRQIIKDLEKDETDKGRALFKLSLLIETGIHLEFSWKDSVLGQIIDIILPFCGSSNTGLEILDQICAIKPNVVKSNDKVPEVLARFLSSRSIDIRLLSSHCLHSIFNSNPCSPYKIFYDTESIEPTVHTYREQILLLQKLETSGEFFKSIKEDRFKVDTLRFLMGMLYHNFKFLWEPVLQLIQDYSKELSTADFWDVYKQKLDETAEEITQLEKGLSTKTDQFYWTSSALSSLQSHGIKESSKQELINYRNLIWSKISSYGQIREVKNRELVTMFLQFVHDEYKANQQKKLYTWDICQDDDKQIPDDEDDDDEVEVITPKKKQSSTSTKTIVSTLTSKMGIFVNQPNPKALHREPELYSFYMELLSGNDPALQKLALDCVMSYKNKSIMPYKDHLYALIDEKKYRDELVSFKIDRAAGTIQDEHRSDFMKVLLRILYGKMTTKTTQKNVSSQAKKGIILRFLGGCSTQEILWFLKMAFGMYDQIIDSDLEDIPNKVQEHFNVNAVWSPKKLQSTINLLELIRKQFGGLMEQDFLIYMLKLIVFVGSVCKEVITKASDEEAKIHPKMTTIFKNVKNTALLSLVNFFEHFQSFGWTSTQMATLAEIFVWGTVEKLPQDSIHSPTPVLKLLLQWGDAPRLYGYLGTKRNEATPFQYVVELLLNDKSKPPVRKPIMGMIEKLLTINGEDQEVDGVEVIKPHILQILKRLKMNFSSGGKNSRRRTNLDKRDLNILSLLTQHVDDTETCDSLLQLLLPILISKSQTSTSEEVVCQVITTLSNLIKKLDQPESYLRKIAPLFEQVQEVSARKMLCQLLIDIGKRKDASTKETGYIIRALNAWDKRWVEQPDYDKRLDALKAITVKLEDESIGVDLDLGVLVIYNCFHFIKYDKDMGLRDNASEHLRVLVPKLIKKYESSRKDIDYLVGDILLNLIRRAIRDANENVHNEGIRLLGEMVRQCSSAHQVLADMKDLADAQDPEVDFFENMTHLQSHRHGRALLKFCTLAKTMTVAPNQRTLTQFIMPLASRYLLNEKHAGKHTLVDAAIEALGTVCQLLPWQHYQGVLKLYLQKMRTTQEHQKHCVRIVVRILDAFHFDLSEASGDKSSIEALKIKLEEKPKEEPVKDDEESDEELDSDLEDIEDDEDEEEQVKPRKAAILDSLTVLHKNAAKRVMQTIATILIPTLNRSITEKSSYDGKHKINRKRFSFEREEEEIQRVPIGLALVKLMQKLPKDVLDTSLPGVFMKVCTFLKSPLKSVRMLTRDILKKIMLTLGASYLAMLLDHLTSLLTRGFQVHVLSVTLHGILDTLRDIIKPGDIEACLSNILEVTLNDIFGELAAEKEVEKIAAHTPEAKPSSKSYLVLHIVARNIQESCLLDILVPFKDYLAKSQSKKMTLKIQDCFQKIVTGLVENPHISRESLLIFVYGTMSESIPDLLPGIETKPLTENEKEKMRRARPDCFIIQPEPKFRAGALRKNVKNNAQANAHILIEFGLEMLHIVLKRKKLTEIAYEPFLNPVLPLIRDSLKSTHIRVTTFSLKCITSIWNEAYELPEFKNYLDDIVKRLFEILQNFSTFGATKQEENFQLMKNAFKCVVALLRKCTEYKLNDTQIDQLIYYIEHDLHEGGNQTMAFSLLKAMVNRKVDTKEMHEIMMKIREITIVSPSDFARDESRAILITYMMEYTLEKRVESYLKFFARQLNYSVPTGRLSVIQFFNTIIKKYPQFVLAKKAEFLFVSLGARLVNDDTSECRKAAAECIELLIGRLESTERQALFDVTLLFFSADKPSVREMAAMLCSRFLATEKEAFESRVKVVLPLLIGRLMLCNPNAPGRFVRAPGGGESIGDIEEPISKIQKGKNGKNGKNGRKFKPPPALTEEEIELIEARKQREIDHELIQMQNCILKILEYCPNVLTKEEFNLSIDEMAYESQKLLGYEHEWARVNSAKISAIVLSTYDFPLVGQIITKTAKKAENQRDYIYLNPESDIKSLVLDLCAQVVPGETNPQMMEEIVKVFLFVANMLRDVPFDGVKIKKEEHEDDDAENDRSKINLAWLVKNMRFLANKELAMASHSIITRSAIFTLVEGLITLLDTETVNKLSYGLLSMLVREMSEEDSNIDPQLRQQAIRVGSRLRKRIGSDVYDKLRSSIQMKLMMRRAERKKLIAQEKVNDPVRAAKRKISIQERKKASKKRRVDVIRGKAEGKKKRKRKAEEDIF
ncbi:small subunit processome component 20 homolog [Episyrphus balteatus]|uniref:small subunit processome component 20 homolog n=1 Tax=Episyrphus balteatus TaxID=286459 RepID=UPI00248642B8|nr:small subunit processome component 20 homolog [Episyrphus balteatus]